MVKCIPKLSTYLTQRGLDEPTLQVVAQGITNQNQNTGHDMSELIVTLVAVALAEPEGRRVRRYGIMANNPIQLLWTLGLPILRRNIVLLPNNLLSVHHHRTQPLNIFHLHPKRETVTVTGILRVDALRGEMISHGRVEIL